jgi:hypothetical protein
MDNDNELKGPDGDMGSYVEDARGYNPEESDESVVDKVKDALGGVMGEDDDDFEDDDVDDDDDYVEDEDTLV